MEFQKILLQVNFFSITHLSGVVTQNSKMPNSLQSVREILVVCVVYFSRVLPVKYIFLFETNN